ncbi:hypothetical protein CFP56_024055 [Quercus suber]|uniref:C2 domain-containing protein n=1 Tax=Quercus suber TaxID=58331 RepID=A0AAW0K747_QUESU
MSRFHLLEINLVSAQDLEPVSKVMHTYAVTWLNPERKLLTRVDQHGYTNPTWNEKFLFRVDNVFLNSDTSAIMVEIHASSWIRDILIGTVRVLVNNLLLLKQPREKANRECESYLYKFDAPRAATRDSQRWCHASR